MSAKEWRERLLDMTLPEALAALEAKVESLHKTIECTGDDGCYLCRDGKPPAQPQPAPQGICDECGHAGYHSDDCPQAPPQGETAELYLGCQVQRWRRAASEAEARAERAEAALKTSQYDVVQLTERLDKERATASAAVAEQVSLRQERDAALADAATARGECAEASGALTEIAIIVTSGVAQSAPSAVQTLAESVLRRVLQSKHRQHVPPKFYRHEWEQRLWYAYLGDHPQRGMMLCPSCLGSGGVVGVACETCHETGVVPIPALSSSPPPATGEQHEMDAVEDCRNHETGSYDPAYPPPQPSPEKQP